MNCCYVWLADEQMESATNGVLGAGAVISWISKDIWETSNVRAAMNSIFITLQANAPLYEGTKIVIAGL